MNTNLLLAIISGHTFTNHGWYYGDNEDHAVKVWDDDDYNYFRRFTENLQSVITLTNNLETKHGFCIEFSRSINGYQLEQVIKNDGSRIEADISSKNLALFLSEVLLKVLVTDEILEKARYVEENYPHHYSSLLTVEK